MCAYCNMGDTWFRYDPPWQPPYPPSIPQPIFPLPAMEWPLEKLKDYLRLLKEVKEMEDKLGCPCEPNKADYIGMFEARIKRLEDKAAQSAAEDQP